MDNILYKHYQALVQKYSQLAVFVPMKYQYFLYSYIFSHQTNFEQRNLVDVDITERGRYILCLSCQECNFEIITNNVYTPYPK